jgi:hypothetical protein
VFKKLWYKVFGVPTTEGVLIEFRRIYERLQVVADYHAEVATAQTRIIVEAQKVRDAATLEVEHAVRKIDRIAHDWL